MPDEMPHFDPRKSTRDMFKHFAAVNKQKYLASLSAKEKARLDKVLGEIKSIRHELSRDDAEYAEEVQETEASLFIAQNFEWEPYPELWVPEHSSYSDYSGDFMNRANAAYWVEKYPNLFTQGTGGHGTVWTGISEAKRHAFTADQFESVKEDIESLENYPSLDDDAMSRMESDAKYEYWNEYGRKEVREVLAKKAADSTSQLEILLLTNEEMDELSNDNGYWDQNMEVEEGGNVYLRVDRCVEDLLRSAGDVQAKAHELQGQLAHEVKLEVYAKHLHGTFVDLMRARWDKENPRLVMTVEQASAPNSFPLFERLLNALEEKTMEYSWDIDASDVEPGTGEEGSFQRTVGAVSVSHSTMADAVELVQAGHEHAAVKQDPRQLKLPGLESMAGMLANALLEGETPKEFFKRRNQVGHVSTMKYPCALTEVPVGYRFKNALGAAFTKLSDAKIVEISTGIEVPCSYGQVFPSSWNDEKINEWYRRYYANNESIVGETPKEFFKRRNTSGVPAGYRLKKTRDDLFGLYREGTEFEISVIHKNKPDGARGGAWLYFKLNDDGDAVFRGFSATLSGAVTDSVKAYSVLMQKSQMRADESNAQTMLVEGDSYSSSCLMVPLADNLCDFLTKWSQLNIPNKMLHYDEEGGLGHEDEYHVTAYYGIKGKEPSKELLEVLRMTEPFKVRVGKISLFENDDYDVIKMDVESEGLKKLNAEIVAKCDVKPSDYPDYKPHVTLAYAKKGSAAALVGVDPWAENQGLEPVFTAQSAIFAGPGDEEDSERVKVRLYFGKIYREEGQETPKEFFKRRNVQGSMTTGYGHAPVPFNEVPVGADYMTDGIAHKLRKENDVRGREVEGGRVWFCLSNARTYPPEWTVNQIERYRQANNLEDYPIEEGMPSVRLVDRLLSEETPKEFFKRRDSMHFKKVPKRFRDVAVGDEFKGASAGCYLKIADDWAMDCHSSFHYKWRRLAWTFSLDWNLDDIRTWLKKQRHTQPPVQESASPFDELNFPTDSSRLGFVLRNKRNRGKTPLAAPEAVPFIV